MIIEQDQYDAKEIEYGKWLFSGPCDFKLGITTIDQLQQSDFPEIAFAGLSNVGKSSLVNALTGRKTLAKTSSTPGRTKQLNFFLLRENLMIVDLPGYGYAKASKKDIKVWTDLTIDYLKGRPNLKRVCLLIDSRRHVKENDHKVMDILDDAAVPYQIILTKCDKSKKDDVDKIISDIKVAAMRHTALHPNIIITSSRDASGINLLRAELANLSKRD
ncbi:ribosome biogenesis GTP-binding protein YihA/YsxC [Rickettsiales bacterium]|nr:ribosome biogenesis GTP-binding protein YihA/YsxC [Rickettsiales bacterium]